MFVQSVKHAVRAQQIVTTASERDASAGETSEANREGESIRKNTKKGELKRKGCQRSQDKGRNGKLVQLFQIPMGTNFSAEDSKPEPFHTAHLLALKKYAK